MKNKFRNSRKILAVIVSIALILSLSSCKSKTDTSNTTDLTEAASALQSANVSTKLSESDITVNETLTNSADGEHVISVSGEEKSYSNTKNSDKSDYYQAVMIYQSMSGDAAQGLSSFTMNGGKLNNENGDIFFVNNTATEITLKNAAIVNNDSSGVFLRAAAAGWGSSGSNGGQVNLTASSQEINGDMIVDDISVLNLYLSDNSKFNGAINSDGQAGDVYVELSGGSKWTLTADSYVTSLTCDADSIDLNGHTLYVGGVAYTAGTASTGTAIEITVSTSSGGNMGEIPGQSGQPNDAPPSKPN